VLYREVLNCPTEFKKTLPQKKEDRIEAQKKKETCKSCYMIHTSQKSSSKKEKERSLEEVALSKQTTQFRVKKRERDTYHDSQLNI
jgi:hypothetical protein